jgi:hypothetical protein
MKPTYFLSLLLALVLTLGTAPTAHTGEPPNAPGGLDITYPPQAEELAPISSQRTAESLTASFPFDVAVDEPIKLQADTFNVPSASSAPDRLPSASATQSTANNWYIETVDGEGNVGSGNSLVLDRAGQPHISYLDYTDRDLKYAWHDGVVWHIQTVAGETDVFGTTSLALDGADRPHISYLGGITASDLQYARLRTPVLSLDKQATPTDGLRNNDTLTYTLTISGPGLSVRLWDPLPPLVQYVPGSITDTIGSLSSTLKLPAAAYSPTVHAVVWEGTLPTDTVEVIQFQVTRGITGTGSLSLSLPIVNTAWLTDTESGWSVSDTVIVNGRHIYLPVILR